MYSNVAIIGSSGAIGEALIKHLQLQKPDIYIHAFSQKLPKKSYRNTNYYQINYEDEQSIADSAEQAAKNAPLDLIIVATGILHDDEIKPEKSLKDLSAKKFYYIFSVNTIVPAIIAKYFIPKLSKDKRSIFTALSARVGSISDNHLGGWYAYRASKTALNMIIKNAAIETARQNKNVIIVGLHPGTVDSTLSKPFQSNISKRNLFTPDQSADNLISVLNNLSTGDSGKCIAWNGLEIKP